MRGSGERIRQKGEKKCLILSGEVGDTQKRVKGEGESALASANSSGQISDSDSPIVIHSV